MKSTQQFSQFLNKIHCHHWVLIISFLICATIAFLVHNFALKNYSPPRLLVMASGLGVIAGVWLAYSLFRRYHH